MPRGVKITPGPDPTFDAPAPKAAVAGKMSKIEAARAVGATMENYARHLSNDIAMGAISQVEGERKLKKAAGVLPER